MHPRPAETALGQNFPLERLVIRKHSKLLQNECQSSIFSVIGTKTATIRLVLENK
jgi:hypothetical protein